MSLGGGCQYDHQLEEEVRGRATVIQQEKHHTKRVVTSSALRPRCRQSLVVSLQYYSTPLLHVFFIRCCSCRRRDNTRYQGT